MNYGLWHLFLKFDLVRTTIIIIINSEHIWSDIQICDGFIFFRLIFVVRWNWFYHRWFWQLQLFTTLKIWIISMIKPLFARNTFNSLLFWSANFFVKQVVMVSNMNDAEGATACDLFEHYFILLIVLIGIIFKIWIFKLLWNFLYLLVIF